MRHAVLDLFNREFGGRPLLLFLVLLAPFVWRRRHSPGADGEVWAARARRLITASTLLGLAAYLAIGIWYAAEPHFFDNAEPTIPALAWLFRVGQPLYPSVDAPARYAHIYGPMAFIPYALVFAALGPSIAAAKALGVIVALASLAFLHRTIRQHASPPRALTLTGACALLLLLFRNYSFWTRPDPLQLLFVSASLFFATSGRGSVSALLVGLSSGLLWDVKFTGPLYSLPVFALLQCRSGWRSAAIAAATGLVVSVAPFLFWPNVSLPNYLAWIRLSARTGLLLSLLRQNIEWAAYLSLPLLLSFYAVPRGRRPSGPEWRNMLLGLGLGVCAVVVAAAKPGAGPYHLLPFLPVIMYLVSWQISNCSRSETVDSVVARAAIAFLLATAMIAVAQQARLITTIMARSGARELEDIKQFADSHTGVVEMGYGDTEALSLERPILVFRNGSYLLDQPAVREHQLQGVEIPRATIDALAECRVKYWLIPKGERPFGTLNAYSAVLMRPLYSPEFREAFAATYKPVSSTAYYDVWECQSGKGT
jgi:hypothetical protein